MGYTSYEALLRVQKRKPKIGNGSKLGKKRLRITIIHGPLTGVECELYSDSTMPEGMRIDYCPAIGLLENDSPVKYKYYHPDKITMCTSEIYNRLHDHKDSILYVGMSSSEATSILEKNGYFGSYKLNSDISSSFLFPTDKVVTQVNIRIDTLLRRLAAKSIFNFMCYTITKESILHPRYNGFREFIRYGSNAEHIIVQSTCDGIKGINCNKENDHIVGLGLTTFEEKPCLAGFVSWFGAVSYLFIITPIPISNAPELPMQKQPYAVYRYDSEDIIISWADITINWFDISVEICNVISDKQYSYC